MKQSTLSAALLGLFLGVSACTPTAVRVQPEAQTEGTQAEGTQPEGIQEPPASTDTTPVPATKIPVTEQKIEKKRPSKAAIPDNPDAQDASTSTELAESWDDDLCSDMVTQQEMNSCARDSYEQADAQLNLVYQTLKGDLPDSGQQALQSAELAWIEFRAPANQQSGSRHSAKRRLSRPFGCAKCARDRRHDRYSASLD